MKAYRFEILFALLLALVVGAVWHQQAPNAPLSRDEVDRYVDIFAAKFPIPSPDEKADAVARLRDFGMKDDGSEVFMLNLLRFNEKMAEGPDAPKGFTGTPVEANKFYEGEAEKLLLKTGTLPVFAGTVGDRNVIGGEAAEDRWDRILVVHYPSRRAFFELLTDPAYLKIAAYKSYALHMALVPVKRELVLPELRIVVASSAAILFFAVAWFRAVRRRKITR